MKNEVYIIAEVAQGFEGKPEQARLLMKAAASAKADAVKYQLVYADELATPDYKYYNLFKSLEMPDEVWEDLASNAKELGVDLILDIFGIKSLKLAERIGVTTVKLHGTDLTNIGLLNEVASSRIVQRVLLGAGGGHISELMQALDLLSNKVVIVLAGFQGYPTATEDNQISRVKFLNNSLSENNANIKIGFADHASPHSLLSFALASMAIGAGAEVIEKHITLGKNMKIEDFESALNPDEFEQFTDIIRNAALAFGTTMNNEDFGMSDSEIGYREMIRRHVVANKDLDVGSIIQPGDLVLKRTSSSHFITDMKLVYHRKLNRSLKHNSAISPTDI